MMKPRLLSRVTNQIALFMFSWSGISPASMFTMGTFTETRFGVRPQNFSGYYITHDHPRDSRPILPHPRDDQSPKSQNSNAQWSLTCKKHSKILISRPQRRSRIRKSITRRSSICRTQWRCPQVRSYNGFRENTRKSRKFNA